MILPEPAKRCFGSRHELDYKVAVIAAWKTPRTSADPRDACNRLSHISTLKVGQTCRTLILSPDVHVIEGSLLELVL